MSASSIRAADLALDPIGLEELVGTASFQTRVDRKYVLDGAAARRVLAELGPGTRVLEIDGRRDFAYESVYFDTPDLTSYHLAAHRRRRRFKVRTRTYLDSGTTWLEVKTRGPRGATVKERVPHPVGERTRLGAGRAFVDQVLTGAGVDGVTHLDLDAGLVTRYSRTTLALPGACARATVDTGLTWSLRTADRPGVSAVSRDTVIVETKTGSTASALDRLLWTHGHRPVRISKYGTGLAVLCPDLPGTPWRRVIRRHLDPALTTSTAPLLHDRTP
ncbi:polyphosphate polymerase domain-containing protein [Oerskovia flava]|uniref:polyphosphate polymerase domain-containing protein n=1 Tax=Oerskovia flava TaxID=2986422 RepID=UPI00223F29C8|nr:polyphosphate polymerase domain-containing protein [Oerskovia sp. JB1-3-2]